MKTRIARRALKLALAGMLATGLAGCHSSQRDAVEAAINAAQTAIDVSTSEAEKYAPEQLKAAQDAVQSARAALAKHDYGDALEAARVATEKAKELTVAAKAKKDEATKAWSELSAAVPKALDQAKAKVEAYSKTTRLPAGIDETVVATAREEYDKLKQAWADAVAAYQKGSLVDAATKGISVKDGLQKLQEMLTPSSAKPAIN